MRKQLAKGFAMFMLVTAIAFVTAVVSANAQSEQARATVPFDFIVGDTTLPAGNYAIGKASSGGDCLKISNTVAKGAAMRLTIALDGKSENSKLVFHRYGERYFLAEVWTDENSQGRQLMKGRQERAIEKESVRLASLSGPAARLAYETVAIVIGQN